MRPTDRSITAFGDRLDRWAKDQQDRDPLHRRVTQTNMAQMFGVSTSAVSNWRLGVDVPSMSNLAMIAKKTGIPFSELAELVEIALAARADESGDLADAARDTGRKGKARKVKDKQDQAGTENQDDGGMEGA